MAKKRARLHAPRRLHRWLGLAALVLVALLYAKPVRSFLSIRHQVAQRQSEVRSLEQQKLSLTDQLAFSTSQESLAREARRLGFVRPGEHLYIVKGIPAWRARHRATIGRHG